MNCPKCHFPFEKITYESIEVHRCTHCKGLWFDDLTREHLKAIKGSDAIDSGDPKKGAALNRVDRIECPACRNPMLRMVDARQPHIWFESCPTCYGVFFDAGEFKDYKHHTILDFFKDLFESERK